MTNADKNTGSPVEIHFDDSGDTSTSEQLAIVGAGMATARLVHDLVDAGYSGTISVYGEEPHCPYNRVQLSELLSGEKGWDSLPMLEQAWCQQHGVNLRLGDAVDNIQLQQKVLVTEKAHNYSFDKLVIATGSRAIVPTIKGHDKKGVGVFRTVKDVEQLIEFGDKGGHAVVVGGGLLGLEAAYGLIKRGVKVTLLNRGSRVMNRQLDVPAAEILKTLLTDRGIDIRTNASVLEVLGDDQLQAVRLDNDEVLSADRLIFAIGISPNVALAKTSGIDTNKGILVNSCMETMTPGIFALGECAEFKGETVGIVAPIWEQVKTLTAELVGQSKPYEPKVHATSLKVSGVDLFSSGQFSESPTSLNSSGDNNDGDIVISDTGAGIYRRLSVSDAKLNGAILLGDRHLGTNYEQMINSQKSIGNQVDELMFNVASDR